MQRSKLKSNYTNVKLRLQWNLDNILQSEKLPTSIRKRYRTIVVSKKPTEKHFLHPFWNTLILILSTQYE